MRGALAVLALSACGPLAAKDYGAQLFHDATFAGSKFNTWSCNTCHAVGTGETRMLSGWTLDEAVVRPSYWGGNELHLIDAASFCYVYFMRGAKPFDPAEPRSRALYEYLASLSKSATADAKPFTVVRTVADVPRGDATLGAEVYRQACRDCHGDLHSGSGRNTQLASILPDVKNDYPAIFPGVEPSLVFVEKIRHGQFFGVGGNMPLFGSEMLSDEDLGALLKYLEL